MENMNSSNIVVGGAFLSSHPTVAQIFTPEDFSPEARFIGDTADTFLKKEVLPHTERIESHDIEFMHALMQKAGELGLLGADVPEVYGGLGLDIRTCALLAEKLNWQQSFALTHEAHTVIATLPLMYFGNHSQKSKYLPKLASGEWIGSFALSETVSGSDALGAITRADLTEDGRFYVLNGSKMWITNTGFASLFTVFAKIDVDKFSCFLVESGTPGLSFGKEENKLGMRGTSTRRVILENVKVPKDQLVGEAGKAHYSAFCALNMGRFKLEAGAVGGIKETLAVCAAYSNQRKQFGRPISSFGMVKAKLGEMCARLFGLESAVYRLAGLLDGVFDGIDPTSDNAASQYHRAAEEYAIECGIVKVIGSELYSWATDEAIQIHGGNGYTEEYPVARAWRDQRLLRIGEGANEIVRVNIVSTLLRRISAGRLELSDIEELVHDPNSEDLNLLTVTDSTPVYWMKRHAKFLLNCARSTFGDNLLEEQEVVAAIADIICAAFVLESAWIRCQKLMEAGVSESRLISAVTAARILTWDAMGRVSTSANDVVSRLVTHGADVSSGPNSWGNMMDVDSIGLRRDLANAVLEREGYLW